MAFNLPSNPVDGQVFLTNNLQYKFFEQKAYWRASKILWTAERTTLTFASSVLSPNETANLQSNFAIGYIISAVSIDSAAWLRIYPSSSARSADATRKISEDPSSSTGVALEIISNGNETFYPSTSIYVSNLDQPVSDSVYIRVTNLSNSSTSVSVNLTLIKLGV